jgi:hypothetical protein
MDTLRAIQSVATTGQPLVSLPGTVSSDIKGVAIWSPHDFNRTRLAFADVKSLVY